MEAEPPLEPGPIETLAAGVAHEALYAPDLLEGAAPASGAGRKPADKRAPRT